MALDPGFVKTMNDWVVWFNYNRKNAEAGGVENQIKFMQKAVHGLFFVSAAMADELARIDGAPKTEKRLILPVGVRF